MNAIMKNLFLLIFITSIFSNNLEVDGGLTTTGEIQSPTIQALLDQIAQLQEQIALLQAQVNSSQNSDNQLETRTFEHQLNWSVNGEYVPINFNDIIGQQIDNAIISFFSVKNVSNTNFEVLEFEIYKEDDQSPLSLAQSQYINQFDALIDETATNVMRGESFIFNSSLDYKIRPISELEGNPGATLVFAITANFID